MQHKRFVIDANVIIKYAMHGNIYRLAALILDYELNVFVNGTLLKEVYIALADKNLLKSDDDTIDDVMDVLADITHKVTTTPRYQLCPDPTDNFLFDIAIQNRCKILVTDEKKLLAFKQSPIYIHSLKWFKENYPIK